MHTYTLAVNEVQMRAIVEALEFRMRLTLGQFDVLNGILPVNDEATAMLVVALKQSAFIGLGRDAAYAITNEKVDNRTRVGYDLVQVIRREIDGPGSVWKQETFQRGDQPLAKVERTS